MRIMSLTYFTVRVIIKTTNNSFLLRSLINYKRIIFSLITSVWGYYYVLHEFDLLFEKPFDLIEEKGEHFRLNINKKWL